MKFDYMWRNEVVATVEEDDETEKVTVVNYTDDIMKKPFGINENPTTEDLDEFLESRCFPRARANSKHLLRMLNIDHYDPRQIVRKTYGRDFDDYHWIRFEGEDLDYETQIKLRD